MTSNVAILRQQIFDRLQLKRTPPPPNGSKALCPFHDDLKASMTVWPEGNAYCHAEDRAWSLHELAELLGLTAPTPTRTELTIEATYDYRDEAGELLFQVVRFQGKEIRQRRPHPSKPNEWLWRLDQVRRARYRLPELLESDPARPVYVVEGEKDVDRLRSLGLTATTNPQGAGKWRPGYAPFFRDRRVVVVPDNDGPGMAHALTVCGSVRPVALSVKLLELPGLPPKGDVSDWLDQGHAVEELEAAAAGASEWEPTASDSPVEEDDRGGSDTYYELAERNAHHDLAVKMVERGLLQHGRLICADNRFFFFDAVTKQICEVDSFDMDVLLADRYRLSSKDHRHKFVTQQAKVEAHLRGEQVQVHRFAHYDAERNVMYFDQGNGRLLKLTGNAIQEIDNGSDGVLFTPAPDSRPWTWTGRTRPSGIFVKTLVDNINFSQQAEGHTPVELAILFQTWLLSMAFESVQPTKPLALFVGPEGSGKSFALRRVGLTFLGPSFQVDTPQNDKEDDFWTTVTNRHFAAYNNVDQYVKWLEDDLNRIATGAQLSKRMFFTTNDLGTYAVRCFLGLTARTPRFRRPDTASRLLLFYLDRMNDEDRRAEHELLEQVNSQRDELLTDYVALLNLVVATPQPSKAPVMVRMADFAMIATRIGRAIGLNDDIIGRILRKLKAAQYDYAAEESDLLFLLEEWFAAAANGQQVQLDGHVEKTVTTDELWKQLKQVASDLGVDFKYGNKVQLGKALRDMQLALSMRFSITNSRDMKRRGWTIRPRDSDEDEDADSLASKPGSDGIIQ